MMKYLKTYLENNNEIYYIGVINNESNQEKLLNLGYMFDDQDEIIDINEYIWINIYDDVNYFGLLYYGRYNKEDDLLLNINDIPKRKDLKEYVNFLKNSNKLGLI